MHTALAIRLKKQDNQNEDPYYSNCKFHFISLYFNSFGFNSPMKPASTQKTFPGPPGIFFVFNFDTLLMIKK